MEVKDIPLCNIWNYDETNLMDDLGSEKYVMNCGTVEPVQTTTSIRLPVFLR